jgi:hypothetical protein
VIARSLLVVTVFTIGDQVVDLARRVAQRHKDAVIRKEKGEFCVRSPDNPSWSGGCYPTKSEAEARLKAVEYFKHK